MLKILKGNLIGSIIKTTGSGKVRPVSKKVREQFFDILGDAIIGARFLDLFSGSGIMAFEALSRNAEAAVLVEKDRRFYKILKGNVSNLGLTDRVTVFNRDCYRFLKKPPDNTENFDIIFADPPYSLKDYPGLLKLIRQSGLICNGTGDVCFKVHKRVIPIFEDCPGTRVYGSGDVNLIFFGGE